MNVLRACGSWNWFGDDEDIRRKNCIIIEMMHHHTWNREFTRIRWRGTDQTNKKKNNKNLWHHQKTLTILQVVGLPKPSSWKGKIMKLLKTIIVPQFLLFDLLFYFYLFVFFLSIDFSQKSLKVCVLLLQVVHFITFYAPLWGAILFNGFTYFQVIRMLNNATRVCNHFLCND